LDGREIPKRTPESISELKEMVVVVSEKAQKDVQKFETENEFLRSQIQILSEELKIARLKLYLRISERFLLNNDEIQKTLFPEQFSEDSVSAPDDLVVRTIKGDSLKKLPADSERIEIIHDIPEEEKISRLTIY
jgi:hypothetical protein